MTPSGSTGDDPEATPSFTTIIDRAMEKDGSSVGREGHGTDAPAEQRPLYVVERHDDEEGAIQYEIWNHDPANYGALCILPDDQIDGAKAKAALIARAMNERADLLAALQEIEHGMANTGSFPGKWMTRIRKPDVHRIASAAIAKAEGR